MPKDKKTTSWKGPVVVIGCVPSLRKKKGVFRVFPLFDNVWYTPDDPSKYESGSMVRFGAFETVDWIGAEMDVFHAIKTLFSKSKTLQHWRYEEKTDMFEFQFAFDPKQNKVIVKETS